MRPTFNLNPQSTSPVTTNSHNLTSPSNQTTPPYTLFPNFPSTNTFIILDSPKENSLTHYLEDKANAKAKFDETVEAHIKPGIDSKRTELVFEV
ncbi:hypothetical protein KIW84_023447 [Lathyrus oleraceus]|uniref:Uncharacterized protein n=1 Tax=Pisum sativum TaxID=3888 RepID=A0A9D4YGV4_PEA|nr:hypothetical protein KIW84_023447 [Pisum sativum]